MVLLPAAPPLGEERDPPAVCPGARLYPADVLDACVYQGEPVFHLLEQQNLLVERGHVSPGPLRIPFRLFNGRVFFNSLSCLQGLQESGVRSLALAVHWDYMPSGSWVLGAQSTQGQRPLNNANQKSKTALYLFVETILFINSKVIGRQTTVMSIPCNDKLNLRSRYKANVKLRLHNVFPNRSRNLRVKNQHGAD